MKAISEILLPEGLLYTDEHVWVRVEADTSLFVGISDYAQDQLGEIVYIDMPDTGTFFDSGQDFGTVESLKSVNTLFMPVSGKVIEVNNVLENTPSFINADCYKKGWIMHIAPNTVNSKNKLLSADAYRDMLYKHI